MTMKYTLHAPHQNSRQKAVDRLSVSIKKQLSAVPDSVKGMIADTLVDWMKVMNDEELLMQRIAEINADFESKSNSHSSVTNQWTSRLDLEIRSKQQSIPDESGQPKEEGNQDVREVLWEQTNFGKQFRNAMAHRTNRAGNIAHGVRQIF